MSRLTGRVGHHGRGVGSSQACTSGTTDAPSPLALATRFIEPARMSPTAKMPGTVVSRFSGGSPSRQRRRRDVAAGEHEAVRVAGDLVRQPVAVGDGAEQQEQPARLAPGALAGRGVLDLDPLQPALAAAVDDLGGSPRR